MADFIHWYALKVFFGRAKSVKESLEAQGFECYLPMFRKIVERDGIKHREELPIEPSLLFIKTNRAGVVRAGQLLTDKALFYTRSDAEHHRVPAPIPEREMLIFRLVVSNGAEGLEYLGDDNRTFAKGRKVRVTAGPFAGAEGHIVRIRGDRRLVVSIKGICAVATTYIPSAFLHQIEPESPAGIP